MGHHRTTRIVTTGAVVAVLAASFPSTPASGGSIRRVGRISKGVVHRVIRQRKPRRVVHVVVADVSGPAALKVVLSNGSLPGLARTSVMARAHGAIAAINGDFFRPSGRPVAAFARSGELVQTPLLWAANLAFGRAGRTAFIGHRDVSVKLVSARSGERLRLARVNGGRPRRRQVGLYTKRAGKLARPPRNACSARLRKRGPKRFGPDGTEVIVPFRVGEVDCRRSPMRLRGGIVVAGSRWGRGGAAIRVLRQSRKQKLVWSLGWPKVDETLGGNPVMVRDGKLVWPNLRGPHYIFDAHPRTGVGIKADGKILLVTVDGRRPRHSRGMTLIGFARLMKSLGASHALNLDGGGSTTMVVKGKVVNRPSDGGERPVGSALMIVGKRSLLRSTSVYTSSTDEPTLEGGEIVPDDPEDGAVIEEEVPAWSPAVEDPASIGGLSSWLRAEGETLPPSLLDVARRFDQMRHLPTER